MSKSNIVSSLHNSQESIHQYSDPISSSGNLRMNHVTSLFQHLITESGQLPTESPDIGREFGGVIYYSDEIGALNNSLRTELESFISGEEALPEDYKIEEENNRPRLKIGDNRTLILLKVNDLLNLGQENEQPHFNDVDSTHYTVLNLKKEKNQNNEANGIAICYADSIGNSASNKDPIPKTIKRILEDYGIDPPSAQKQFQSAKQISSANCGYFAIYNALEMLGIKHSQETIEGFILQHKKFLEAEFGAEPENLITNQNHSEIQNREIQDREIQDSEIQDSEFLTVFKEEISEIDIRNINDIQTKTPEIIKTYNEKVRIKIQEIITKLTASNSLSNNNNFNFAIFALGSLARGEMLPNSDFEFGILLDKEFKLGSNIDDYFTNFTTKLEEELKNYNIKLDTAGTHPNGHKGKNRLIGDIDQLLLFQDKSFSKGREQTHQENPYLFTILANPILLLSSSQDMESEYKDYITSVVTLARNPDKLQQITSSLRVSLEKHKPLNSKFGNEQNSIFNPKYDFGRIVNLTFDHLDFYYRLKHENFAFRTIENRMTKLLDQKSALITSRKDKIISSYALGMYLRSISKLSEINLKLQKGQDYDIIQNIIGQLYHELDDIYQSAIIFTENHKQDREGESYYREGYQFKKTNQKEKALEKFTNSTITDPSHYSSYHRKAQIERSLGKNRESLETLQNANNVLQEMEIIPENIAQAKNLRKQALIYQELEKEDKAKDNYFAALKKLLNKQTYQASFDTPKVFLIKILIGLSQINLDANDKKELRKHLLAFKEISHFSTIKVNIDNITSQELIKLSNAIYQLLHDPETKEKVQEKYLNISGNHTNNTEQSPIIYHISDQNVNFIGRKNCLEQLRKSLQIDSACAISQTIAGSGGIGKTQLAKKYAKDNENNYKILWSFDVAMDLDYQFAQLANNLNHHHKSLKIEPINADNIDDDKELKRKEITRQVLDCLRTIKEDYLLIFDDAQDFASIKDYMPKKDQNSISQKHVIITSRNSQCWGDKYLNLNVFSREESILFLLKAASNIDLDAPSLQDLEIRVKTFTKKYGQEPTIESIQDITLLNKTEKQAFYLAKTLHDYPLALAQSAAYIRNYQKTGMDFAKYQTYFENKKETLDKREETIIAQQKQPQIIDDYQKTITTTLDISFTAIENQKPLTYEILKACSLINNRKISTELFEAIIRETYPEHDSDFQLEDVINTLLEHSIIQDFKQESNADDSLIIYQPMNENNYFIHDMVAEIVQNSLKEDVEEYRQHWFLTLVAINKLFGNYSEDAYETYDLAHHLLRTIDSIKDLNQKLELDSYDEMVLSSSHTKIGYVYNYQGDLIEALEQYHCALALEKKQDPDSLDVAISCNNIGMIYQAQGDLTAALEQLQLALKIQERENSDSLEISTIYNNIGMIYHAQEDFTAALEQLQLALEIQKREAPDSLDIARSYNNIGLVYNTQGDLTAALEQFELAFEIQKRKAPDNLSFASICSNIGLIYSTQGDLTGALEQFELALEIQKRKAPGSLKVATIYSNVGIIYQAQGNLTAALEQFELAFEIQKRKAPDSLEITPICSNIGMIYQAQGDLTAALKQFELAFEIEKRKAPDSLFFATICSNIGIIYQSQGDLTAALEQFELALEIQKRKAPDGLSFATTCNNIGIIYQAQGDLTAALEQFELALEIQKRKAPDSLLFATICRNIGMIYQAQGNLTAALEQFELALEIQKRKAPDSLEITTICSNIGMIYQAQGNLTAALEQFELAFEIQKREAPDSLSFSTICSNIGMIYQAQGNLTAALEQFELAFEIQKRKAPDSLSFATICSNIGLIYSAQGDPTAALKQFELALEIQKRKAPDSLEIATVYNNIGMIYQSQGNLTAALEQFELSFEIQKREAPDGLLFATTCSNLGIVYQSQGNLTAALEQFELALEIQKREAPDSLLFATICSNIGLIYNDQGDLTAALEQYQLALEIQKRKAPDSLGIATMYNNIGTIYHTQEDFTAALEQLQLALEIQKRKAPDSLEIARSYNNIGMIYHAQGNLTAALEQFELAFEIQKRKAPDSLLFATICTNIGMIYQAQEDFTAALEQYQLALEIQKREAPDSLEIARLYNNIGMVLRSQGNLTIALKICRFALEIQERKAPNNSMNDTFYSNIHNIRISLEQYQTLEEYLKGYSANALILCDIEELEALEKKLLTHRKSNYIDITQSLYHLAEAYSERGAEEKEIQLLEEIFEIQKETLQDDHMTNARQYFIEAINRKQSLRIKDSDTLLQSAQRNFKEITNHTAIGNIHVEYANFLIQTKGFEGAELAILLLQKVIESPNTQGELLHYSESEKVILPTEIQALIDRSHIIDEDGQKKIEIEAKYFAYFMLIKLNYERNNKEEAEKLVKDFALQLESNLPDPEESENNISENTLSMGLELHSLCTETSFTTYDQKIALLKEEIQIKQNNNDLEITIIPQLNDLADLYLKQNKYDEAIDSYNKAFAMEKKIKLADDHDYVRYTSYHYNKTCDQLIINALDKKLFDICKEGDLEKFQHLLALGTKIAMATKHTVIEDESFWKKWSDYTRMHDYLLKKGFTLENFESDDIILTNHNASIFDNIAFNKVFDTCDDFSQNMSTLLMQVLDPSLEMDEYQMQICQDLKNESIDEGNKALIDNLLSLRKQYEFERTSYNKFLQEEEKLFLPKINNDNIEVLRLAVVNDNLESELHRLLELEAKPTISTLSEHDQSHTLNLQTQNLTLTNQPMAHSVSDIPSTSTSPNNAERVSQTDIINQKKSLS